MEGFIIILLIIVIMVCINGIKIVNSNNICIVERAGKYHCTWHGGVHFKIPVLDKIVARYIDSIMTFEMNPFEVKTSDDKMITLKTTVVLKVDDYYKYTYNQAPQQFTNLVQDELSYFSSKYPSYKFEEALKEIEKMVYNSVDNSPIMNNIGLKALELTLKKQ